nr:immunoglobulin light chain junction region [Macaca mulatta]
CMLALQTPYSF